MLQKILLWTFCSLLFTLPVYPYCAGDACHVCAGGCIAQPEPGRIKIGSLLCKVGDFLQGMSTTMINPADLPAVYPAVHAYLLSGDTFCGGTFTYDHEYCGNPNGVTNTAKGSQYYDALYCPAGYVLEGIHAIFDRPSGQIIQIVATFSDCNAVTYCAVGPGTG